MPLYDFECDRCGAVKEKLVPSGQMEAGRHFCEADPAGPVEPADLDRALRDLGVDSPAVYGTWRRKRFPMPNVPSSGTYSYRS